MRKERKVSCFFKSACTSPQEPADSLTLNAAGAPRLCADMLLLLDVEYGMCSTVFLLLAGIVMMCDEVSLQSSFMSHKLLVTTTQALVVLSKVM